MLRQIGTSDLHVTPVAMGCWPIAGISSIHVTPADSLATLRAAYDSGINFFDTAFAYGYAGESECLIAQALGTQRRQIVIASKGGLHWGPQQKQIRDARPETIIHECELSLQRLQTDVIDLYYLHAPDPDVPIAESAGAFLQLQKQGKIRAVGVSNLTRLEDYEAFHAVCPIAADQLPYNMLQREMEQDRLPWCRAHNVSSMVYWPLMKGLLAGKLARDHVWDPKDGRKKYPVFQGKQWEKTHDFVDRLRGIASSAGISVAQLVIAWTIQRPGITAALCGAKRPEQIQETAQALQVQLTADQLQQIDLAIQARGDVDNRPAVT